MLTLGRVFEAAMTSVLAAQPYLDFLESVATKVHRIVIISIATVHTMAHAGKQVTSASWTPASRCAM